MPIRHWRAREGAWCRCRFWLTDRAFAERLRGPNSSLALPPLAVRDRALDLREDRGRPPREVPPEFREHDAPPSPLEQRLAEFVLEGLNLAAERRLRDAQPLGGAGDVLLFGDGDEVLELLQAHARPA